MFEIIDIEFATRKVGSSNAAISLTATEMDIFLYLIFGAGKTCPRALIIKNIHGRKSSMLERTFDSHINHLKKKLNIVFDDQLKLECRYRVGYRLYFANFLTKSQKRWTLNRKRKRISYYQTMCYRKAA